MRSYFVLVQETVPGYAGNLGMCGRVREGDVIQRVATVAFAGVDARPVDVQVHVAAGLPAFTIVGTIKQSLL